MSNTGYREYVLGPEKIQENIILITGTSRAGKTLLSKVLASHKNVEWIEEPYELYNLTILCGLGMIEKELFRMMFTSSVHELIVNNVLLRNANFRPGDLSSIRNYKSESDITHRRDVLSSRTDVEKYIREVKPYFILDIPDILPFTDVIRDVCENLTVINVVRDPYGVADDCYRKGWFASDDKQLSDNNLFRKYGEHKLPWWVREGEETLFADATVYGKGLLYWLTVQAWNKDEKLNAGRYDIIMRYEDMVGDIDKALKNLAGTIELEATAITEDIKREFKPGFTKPLDEKERVTGLPESESLTVIMKRLGY